MSQVQTAGISSILMQMLRYFTDTQAGIQTVTTDIFRQINITFLFLRGCKVGPTCRSETNESSVEITAICPKFRQLAFR